MAARDALVAVLVEQRVDRLAAEAQREGGRSGETQGTAVRGGGYCGGCEREGPRRRTWQRKHEGSSSSASTSGRPRTESAKRSTCSCHATGTLYCASFSSAKRASLFALSVFACFASANIAYTFEIPNGAWWGRKWGQKWGRVWGGVGGWPRACSLKRSLRRKRLMLNTVSGVSAVNGSSVYLWTELYAKYLLEG